MSIQYNVAAALLTGTVSEENFRLLDDPALHRLIKVIKLDVDDQMTRAYPGQQGGDVEVTTLDGKTRRARLDDVVNATATEVRQRFRFQSQKALGDERTARIENFINGIERADNAGELAELLGTGNL